VEIAGAVVFAIFSGNLDANNQLTSSSTVESAVSATAIQINNGVLSIYATCCSGCPDSICDETVANEFTSLICETPESATAAFSTNCTLVETCAAAPGAEACYQSVEEGVNLTTVPPEAIAPGVCVSLQETEFLSSNTTLGFTTSPIVGVFANDPKSSSCGRGDPFLFRSNMYEFAAGYAQTVMIIFAVIAGIQFFVFLAGCYVVCCAAKDDDK